MVNSKQRQKQNHASPAHHIQPHHESNHINSFDHNKTGRGSRALQEPTNCRHSSSYDPSEFSPRQGRLSFGYFSLPTQRKVTGSPAGDVIAVDVAFDCACRSRSRSKPLSRRRTESSSRAHPTPSSSLNLKPQQLHPLPNLLADAVEHLPHHPIRRRTDGVLHLHRLHHQ